MKSIQILIRACFVSAIASAFISNARAGVPIAVAGSDIVVADYNADQEVTVKLNGSASSSPDGAIVSYAWSWPGGSATGATPELVFPVRNGAITVSLTVTDVLNQSATDTLEVSVYDKETALFTDFQSQSFRDIGSGVEGYISGDLLIIDTGPDRAYRRSGTSWLQETLPSAGGNKFVVSDQAVVSASLGFGGSPVVTRFENNAWNNYSVTFSPTDTILDGFNNQRVMAMDASTVVIADTGYDQPAAQDGGRVRIYNWSGDTWVYETDLTPPSGFIPNGAFGTQVKVQGDVIVVSSWNPVSESAEFHVFRKTEIITGVFAWAHEITFDGKRSVQDAVGDFRGGFGYGNNVLVATRFLETSGTYELAIYEKGESGWSQLILNTAPGTTPFEYLRVDSDGDAFAASGFDATAPDFLFKRPGLSWLSGTLNSQPLLTTDNPSLRVSDFSNNLLTMRDGVAGVLRVIDTETSVFPINVEPLVIAGLDIETTSFDGQPVTQYLNGTASFDIDPDETLEAVWTWYEGGTPLGSAPGLETFAEIPPQATSVELKLTDSKGAISKDSIAVDIVRPPVIAPLADRVVVDSDADGLIRLNIDAQVSSSDHPIVSYSWAWPGGVFSGQSGTITLGPAANGKDVTVTVVDSAGLASQSSFRFTLASPLPVPDIIAPANAQNNDQFGWSVAINGTSAMVGALNKPATYQLENINGVWQQISLSPGAQQGSAVALAGDFAFSGAFQASSGTGRVRSLVKAGGVWGLSSLLAPPTNNFEQNGIYPFNFGLTLARSGNRLVVGAPRSSIFDSVTSANFCGAAFVYQLVNGSWVLEQTLKSLSPETDGGFGTAVAIHGQTIAVGSSKNDEVYNSGLVEVFELGTVWNHVATLENASGASGSDAFGRSLAMNDTEILAGAPGQGNGQVYRYKKNIGGIWQSNGVILPTLPPSPNLTMFGSSLSLKDSVLVVGVPGDSTGTNRGGVQTFLLDNNIWKHRGSLAITSQTDPATGSNFIQFADGQSSISHDGSNLIVGAKQARTSSGVQSGKAYIYRNYAALDPNANFEPLAHAGPDISVADILVRDTEGCASCDPIVLPTFEITEPLGSEMVPLNGAASTDQENAIASYVWNWSGGMATGVSPSARFPVGTTTVTLTVTDNKGIVSTDTVDVTVSLSQITPDPLPLTSGNTLTVDLPTPDAKWRLSSEFLWHGDNESTAGVVEDATYQVEILPYPGSTEVINTVITVAEPAYVEVLELEIPSPPTTTGTLSFPETSQGFSWRLVGESEWRNTTDDGDEFPEDIEYAVPTGPLRIEFRPVAGFTTPSTRLVEAEENSLIVLDWAEYLRINSFDPSKTFELANTSILESAPYRHVGMIRSRLGRGSGTVVADRVVLTAAHLFFDANGLQWGDTQWFSRQQQGAYQAPPITPRGVLYQTSYAKLVAPDSVEGTVADLPDDPQEVDFAVLYFTEETEWDQGSANFLQSSPEKNWLTGSEDKHAVGYPQRSQLFENRGRIFEKEFSSPLQSLGTGLYETTEVFGDGGASGSALFVQPAGTGLYYPAAVLLAGQGRAVYRIIDEDVTRMIKDAEDAATGNDDVLNNDSSLVDFDGLGSLTTIGVQVFPSGIRTKARWTITPVKGTSTANMATTKKVAFNEKWSSYTITLSAISGYKTPAPLKVFNGNVDRGEENIHPFTYTVLPPPAPAPTPLQTWKSTYSITNMSSDNDRDGMNALLEYALDRNPNVNDQRTALRIVDNPSQNLRAEFDVYVSSAAAGITYRVKASNSADRSNPVTLATFTSAVASSGYRRVTDTQLRSVSPRRFAWLEVTLP